MPPYCHWRDGSRKRHRKPSHGPPVVVPVQVSTQRQRYGRALASTRGAVSYGERAADNPQLTVQRASYAGITTQGRNGYSAARHFTSSH